MKEIPLRRLTVSCLLIIEFYAVGTSSPLVDITKKFAAEESSKPRKNNIHHIENVVSLRHRINSVQHPDSDQKKQPKPTKMEKGGTSTADLSDLASTPPAKRENPKRREPRLSRKVFRKPKVKEGS